MKHYITKYKANGKTYAEAWLQINIFGKCFCFWRKIIEIKEGVSMLVKNGDYLCRDNQWYGVICADENCFVIGKARYDETEKCRHISYENLEAYSNDETINTLEQLNFQKETEE